MGQRQMALAQRGRSVNARAQGVQAGRAMQRAEMAAQQVSSS
jgi:hypothetical protein